MSEPLKPCPFCGQPPYSNAWKIGCDDCGIEFEGEVPEDFEDVLTAWSSRAPTDPDLLASVKAEAKAEAFEEAAKECDQPPFGLPSRTAQVLSQRMRKRAAALRDEAKRSREVEK